MVDDQKYGDKETKIYEHTWSAISRNRDIDGKKVGDTDTDIHT